MLYIACMFTFVTCNAPKKKKKIYIKKGEEEERDWAALSRLLKFNLTELPKVRQTKVILQGL